jgi:hypothetical protein
LEQETLKGMFRGQYNKKQLTFFEQAFMFWYVSIFGDQWKIIADVINYHPFTRGYIRDPEELRTYFYTY